MKFKKKYLKESIVRGVKSATGLFGKGSEAAFGGMIAAGGAEQAKNVLTAGQAGAQAADPKALEKLADADVHPYSISQKQVPGTRLASWVPSTPGDITLQTAQGIADTVAGVGGAAMMGQAVMPSSKTPEGTMEKARTAARPTAKAALDDFLAKRGLSSKSVPGFEGRYSAAVDAATEKLAKAQYDKTYKGSAWDVLNKGLRVAEAPLNAAMAVSAALEGKKQAAAGDPYAAAQSGIEAAALGVGYLPGGGPATGEQIASQLAKGAGRSVTPTADKEDPFDPTPAKLRALTVGDIGMAGLEGGASVGIYAGAAKAAKEAAKRTPLGIPIYMAPSAARGIAKGAKAAELAQEGLPAEAIIQAGTAVLEPTAAGAALIPYVGPGIATAINAFAQGVEDRYIGTRQEQFGKMAEKAALERGEADLALRDAKKSGDPEKIKAAEKAYNDAKNKANALASEIKAKRAFEADKWKREQQAEFEATAAAVREQDKAATAAQERRKKENAPKPSSWEQMTNPQSRVNESVDSLHGVLFKTRVKQYLLETTQHIIENIKHVPTRKEFKDMFGVSVVDSNDHVLVDESWISSVSNMLTEGLGRGRRPREERRPVVQGERTGSEGSKYLEGKEKELRSPESLPVEEPTTPRTIEIPPVHPIVVSKPATPEDIVVVSKPKPVTDIVPADTTIKTRPAAPKDISAPETELPAGKTLPSNEKKLTTKDEVKDIVKPEAKDIVKPEAKDIVKPEDKKLTRDERKDEERKRDERKKEKKPGRRLWPFPIPSVSSTDEVATDQYGNPVETVAGERYSVFGKYGDWNPWQRRMTTTRRQIGEKYTVHVTNNGKTECLYESSIRGVRGAIHGKDNYRVLDSNGSDITDYFKTNS
jgi:hypothetical protein